MKIYSDGTRVLDWAEAEIIIRTYADSLKHSKKVDHNQLNALQQILLLIGASEKELNGNIRLQKEAFLVANEYLDYERKLEDLRFVPYRLGPYSFKLAELTNALIISGYLGYRGRKNSNNQAYYLTSKGRNIFNKLRKSNSKLAKTITMARKELDEFSPAGLLRYIYSKPEYRKYTTKSTVKKLYMDVTWGRHGA